MRPKKQPSGRKGESEAANQRGVRDVLFLEAYPFARRAAQMRAATFPRSIYEDREDLEQHALVSVWAAIHRFDKSRASLRTFVERIVASSISSISRRMRAEKRTRPPEFDPPSSLQLIVRVELRVDLQRLIGRLCSVDRKVAQLLPECRPTEIAHRLKMSRAAVYRSITRIRTMLQEGGIC